MTAAPSAAPRSGGRARSRTRGRVLLRRFVTGRPSVPRGSTHPGEPHDLWTTSVLDETVGLPPVAVPCELEVEFLLPADRDPWELPWERSLEHLLQSLLRTLDRTVLRYDSIPAGAVRAVSARWREVAPGEAAGAWIVLRRVGAAAAARPVTPA